MKTWIAILLTFGLIGGCGLIHKLCEINIFPFVIVGASVWVGVDSSQTCLAMYESGISYRPVTLGVLCSMLWIVAFPWYLVMRHRIRTGKARLRKEYEPFQMADGRIGPNGLLQPWSGRKL